MMAASQQPEKLAKTAHQRAITEVQKLMSKPEVSVEVTTVGVDTAGSSLNY